MINLRPVFVLPSLVLLLCLLSHAAYTQPITTTTTLNQSINATDDVKAVPSPMSSGLHGTIEFFNGSLLQGGIQVAILPFLNLSGLAGIDYLESNPMSYTMTAGLSFGLPISLFRFKKNERIILEPYAGYKVALPLFLPGFGHGPFGGIRLKLDVLSLSIYLSGGMVVALKNPIGLYPIFGFGVIL